MSTIKKLYLWSHRHDAVRGNHWRQEREVTAENHSQWRAVFEADEPDVLFLVSAHRLTRHPLSYWRTT